MLSVFLPSRQGVYRLSFHGALLDSQLLAEVYLELLGGRARKFDFGGKVGTATGARVPAQQRPAPLAREIPDEDQATHAEFVDSLGADAIWNRYA